MDYLKTNLKWEDFFATESVELEEKMLSLDMDSLNKSKIRLSLETKILDWDKYQAWVLENLGCASLKNDVKPADLELLLGNVQDTLDSYAIYDFWGEDLMPIMKWDDQVIIFGIQYNENLLSIPNHIFILTPPEILSYISKTLFKGEENSKISEEHERKDLTSSGIEGLSPQTAPLSFDFKSLSKHQDSEQTSTKSINTELTNTQKIEIELNDTPKPGAYEQATSNTQVEFTRTTGGTPIMKSEKEVWDFINERHGEYIFEVRKQFTAYLVLKVDYDKTRVYKMDPDLAHENVNEQLFNYSLKEENPFKRVFESGEYESFSVSQLGLNLKNFKYACITALKAGNKVVGFLVGFKDTNLSEIDQMLLEELTKETAA